MLSLKVWVERKTRVSSAPIMMEIILQAVILAELVVVDASGGNEGGENVGGAAGDGGHHGSGDSGGVCGGDGDWIHNFFTWHTFYKIQQLCNIYINNFLRSVVEGEISL